MVYTKHTDLANWRPYLTRVQIIRDIQIKPSWQYLFASKDKTEVIKLNTILRIPDSNSDSPDILLVYLRGILWCYWEFFEELISRIKILTRLIDQYGTSYTVLEIITKKIKYTIYKRQFVLSLKSVSVGWDRKYSRIVKISRLFLVDWDTWKTDMQPNLGNSGHQVSGRKLTIQPAKC